MKPKICNIKVERYYKQETDLSSLHIYIYLFIYLDITRTIYMQISSYDCKIKGINLPYRCQ